MDIDTPPLAGRSLLALSYLAPAPRTAYDSRMRAMVLEKPGHPLELRDLAPPTPRPHEILVRVLACAVCRTDLHIVDGELARPKLPLVPGHEVVGRVEALGSEVRGPAVGDRIGIPWLGWTCGRCRFCGSGQENLCREALFTGYTIDGGYAEYAVADSRYAFPIPDLFDDIEAAPLLCAGLIGYRAFRRAGEGRRLGIYGFGAAAHLVAQLARSERRDIYAFTRPGDVAGQDFARSLGAAWAGGSDQLPPDELDAVLIFAPVGSLVPAALRAVAPGGTVVCAGIHMSEIPAFPYELLWRERVLRSVANLTRRDAEEFLGAAANVPIRAAVEPLRLEDANEALKRVRQGESRGALVLVP